MSSHDSLHSSPYSIIKFHIFESYNTAKLQAFLRDKHYKFSAFKLPSLPTDIKLTIWIS